MAYLGASRHNFESKSSTAAVKPPIRLCRQTLHFSLCGIVSRMGVIIQHHRDVGVSHDILQYLGIQPAFPNRVQNMCPYGIISAYRKTSQLCKYYLLPITFNRQPEIYQCHSFFRIAYRQVFSYRGVPSGLFTNDTNSTNKPSRRIPSFSHKR